MRSRHDVRHGRAFTLVELLVVTGVISLLVALLMPAIAGARKQAHAAVCGAHLRSIGQALVMYTQQYRHYPGTYINDGGYHRALWPVRLRPFTGGDQGVFYCPAHNESCEWKKVPAEPGKSGRATEEHATFGYEVGEPLLDTFTTPFSYGYNYWGAQSGMGDLGLGQGLRMGPDPTWPYREIPVNRVRKPAEMVAIADARGDGFGDFSILPYRTEPRMEPGFVHNGFANVLFCDGHVQRYREKELLVTYNVYIASEDPVRRMWNSNHRVVENGYD